MTSWTRLNSVVIVGSICFSFVLNEPRNEPAFAGRGRGPGSTAVEPGVTVVNGLVVADLADLGKYAVTAVATISKRTTGRKLRTSVPLVNWPCTLFVFVFPHNDIAFPFVFVIP